MLQFDDEDLSDIGGYDLVHHDDLAYVASAHQECKPNFKIVYRIVINPSQPYCLVFICRTLSVYNFVYLNPLIDMTTIHSNVLSQKTKNSELCL